MSLRGIDVSRHQGTIDWEKVKAWKNSANGETVQFVIIRAGYGKYEKQEDPMFERNVTECIRLNIPFGVYWYSYATSVDDAKKEAEVCIKVINPYKEYIKLPVFFDQEYERAILALNNQTRTDMCKAFITLLKDAGYQSGLYASLDWFENKVYDAELASYPAWVAQYGTKCTYEGDNLYIWQSASTGRVDGISGNVDMDTGYFTLSTEKDHWEQDEKGWWYKYADGGYAKNRWHWLNGNWYYFNSEGYAVTGWQQVDNVWYYFVTLEDSQLTGYKECACMEISKNE